MRTPAPIAGLPETIAQPDGDDQHGKVSEERAAKKAATITEHEMQQVARANQTKKQPVVFIHGLWLLPSSWDRWATLFEDAGYAALTPGWPDDPETVEEAQGAPRGVRQQDHRPGRRPLRRHRRTA